MSLDIRQFVTNKKTGKPLRGAYESGVRMPLVFRASRSSAELQAIEAMKQHTGAAEEVHQSDRDDSALPDSARFLPLADLEVVDVDAVPVLGAGHKRRRRVTRTVDDDDDNDDGALNRNEDDDDGGDSGEIVKRRVELAAAAASTVLVPSSPTTSQVIPLTQQRHSQAASTVLVPSTPDAQEDEDDGDDDGDDDDSSSDVFYPRPSQLTPTSRSASE